MSTSGAFARLSRRRTCSAQLPHCQRQVCRAAAGPSEEASVEDTPATVDDIVASTQDVSVTATPTEQAANFSRNGAPDAVSTDDADLPIGEPVYKAPTGGEKFMNSLRLLRALPWRRFQKGSILVIEVKLAL